MAKKVAIFESYYEAARDLPPEQFKEFFSCIFEKAFYDIEPSPTGTIKMMYSLVKPTLEKSLALSEARAAAGRLGGAPEGNSNAIKQAKTSKNKQKQATNKQKQADKDKEEDKEEDIGEKREAPQEPEKKVVASAPSRFVKPTIEEVAEYCRQRGNGIDPEQFIAFYESKGWKVGSQPMKNWKACVITWEGRRRNSSGNGARDKPRPNSFCDFTQNQYSTAEMEDLERRLLDN